MRSNIYSIIYIPLSYGKWVAVQSGSFHVTQSHFNVYIYK